MWIVYFLVSDTSTLEIAIKSYLNKFLIDVNVRGLLYSTDHVVKRNTKTYSQFLRYSVVLQKDYEI